MTWFGSTTNFYYISLLQFPNKLHVKLCENLFQTLHCKAKQETGGLIRTPSHVSGE